MKYSLKLEKDMVQKLCCPVCKSKLTIKEDGLSCVSEQCRNVFPVINGIPILINENNSLFSISDFTSQTETYFPARSKLERLAKKFIPVLGWNIKAKANLRQFAQLLLKNNPNPRVLIIGGSIVGQGMESILSIRSITFVESDVSFGPRTILICDAHDIPFENDTFDGVIAQAVFEHVIDPYRCVEEIHRILKRNGIIYAETPFMQNVHGGRYDFTRFTHLGHRRLLRKFDEICSGAGMGPGMSLAWSYNAFLLSFARSKFPRAIMKVFARFTCFWLKYLDYYLIKKPGSLDSACLYYFMGTKSDKITPDKQIINEYRGTYI